MTIPPAPTVAKAAMTTAKNRSEAFRLRLEGMRTIEIAEALGVSKFTINRWLLRVLRIGLAALAKHYDGRWIAAHPHDPDENSDDQACSKTRL